MGKILLNNAFNLEYPDEFHVMDAEERSKLSFAASGDGECLQDDDRHIMISIAWQKLGGFTDLMLNAKDLAKNIRKGIQKLMGNYGYSFGGNLSRKIAGNRAEGFSYTYTAKDIAMYGEAYAMKSDKTVYYFYLYAREELKDESVDAWNKMLETIK